MESADNHRRRAAGVPDVIYASRSYSSSRRGETVLIIKDPQIEFLKILKSQTPKNESSGGDCREPTVIPSKDVTTKSGKPPKACPVCLQDIPALTGIPINAVINCEHVICFECALRLIFIANKCDCPICRQKLTKVILTHHSPLDQAEEVKKYLARSRT